MDFFCRLGGDSKELRPPALLGGERIVLNGYVNRQIIFFPRLHGLVMLPNVRPNCLLRQISIPDRQRVAKNILRIILRFYPL
jgi:hypothetical protein